MQTQNQMNNWLAEELNEIASEKPKETLKPALKLEENKIYEIELVKEAKWDRWVDPNTHAVKKIIPIRYNNTEMVFFLNCQNPTYREIVKRAAAGQLKFKIIRLGQAKATRYNLVE